MGTLGVAEHARHKPGHRVNDDHRRHFAAGKHIVADRDLLGPDRLGNPGVKALVAAANEHEPLAGGELFCERLVEPPPARCEQDDMPHRSRLGLNRLDRGNDRTWHQEHARAATKGTIIHVSMRPLGKVSDVGEADIKDPGGLGCAQ